MGELNGVDLWIGAADTDGLEKDASARSFICFDDATPIRKYSQCLPCMFRGAYKRKLAQATAIVGQLRWQAVEAVEATLDLVAVNAPVDDSNVNTDCRMCKAELIDYKRVGRLAMRFELLRVKGGSDVLVGA
jgi:hypothetical protein